MNLNTIRDTAARWLTKPLLPVLARSRLSPNIVTILGLAVNIGAAAVIAKGHLVWGGLLILFSGLFDLLDGSLARITGKVSVFGALLDSVCDRIAEAALLMGLLLLYLEKPDRLEIIILVFLTLVGSFLISYIRARAEGLGIACRVGWFTRAERVIVLALGLLLNQVLIALLILAVLTFVTVGQRLVYVWQTSRKS